MKKENNILKVIVLAVILIVLMRPSINPFISDATRGAISAQLRSTFGVLAGGGETGFFTIANIVTALAVIVFMWLLTTVVCMVINAVSKGKRRSMTVAGLAVSVIKTVAAIVTFVWVLTVMGINAGAIFASLGIISLIIGFGVQSLIEDCVTGIFMIFEGLINIGDIIVLGEFRGEVVRISMRTTTIKDTSGNLQIINNSDIRNIQNRSDNPSYAICHVGVSYDCDIREVEKVVMSALPDIYEKNRDVFISTPTYSGVQELGDSAVVIRVMALCEEKNYFIATRRLNREMKILLDENNIEIPFQQVVVHQAKD